MMSSTSAKKSTSKPKLIVFDLDYTLWPFWVDTHVRPPVRLEGDKVLDKSNREVKYYSGAPEVLQHLQEEGYTLALASRTTAVELANQLLDLFKWDKYFAHKEIYPGSKTTHFQRLNQATRIKYEEMIFFDDEHRNIRDVGGIGVHSILVEQGVSMKIIQAAFSSFSSKSKPKA